MRYMSKVLYEINDAMSQLLAVKIIGRIGWVEEWNKFRH